ncbi:DpnD/PcfM family protein [Erysipelotrichaceae bacterium HCN-30851]
MSKVIVRIEEHLVKEIEVECPDSMNVDERMEYAENKITEAYRKEEIVLTAEDYNGITLREVEDVETGFSTEWKEIY